ncbi:translation initiation factor IF-2 domain protein [Leptospira interrogans serovar Pyrogenes str. 200701872]|uniref:Translation initiation factor IF-2 domain protein n=1 Tax=Leptospira interrogans serovar Pyrogenes str. 200701872 TaxID=1193029 RepID=M7A434_LEPIR|nr:translation initiation factor IF-2 domain protein [Leptospira interrogans serovar Pyrogenes str. 200701872]
MEDKNKTIKETLQGSADAGKRKKLIIKKKGDDPSTPSPAASPKKETVAESAPSSKPPVMPLPLPGDSGQSPIVRPAPSSHSPAKREESPGKQDAGRPPRDKDTRQGGGSSYPPSRSPFQKEDSNIIVSRPIQRTGPSRPNSGGGYQGNRGPGQGGGGYQGNRGPGQGGGGYQGNRGPGQGGGGYQGNRGPGQGGGGYQGNRGPRSGGTGTRPMPITSAEVELSQSRGSSVTSKKRAR